MKHRTQIAMVVTATVLLAALVWAAYSPESAAQEDMEPTPPARTVAVSGTGKVEARPDTVVISLGVETETETAAAALTETSQTMNAVLAALRDAGVAADDLQTQSIQVYPRYEDQPDPETGQRALAGYRASNIVQVRSKNLAGFGALLDSAMEAGANRVESIRFEVSEAAALLDQAREAAWADAEHKAEQLAGLADAELGLVLSIDESTGGPVPVTRGVAQEAAAVPVEPGTQTVEVDLHIQWQLR